MIYVQIAIPFLLLFSAKSYRFLIKWSIVPTLIHDWTLTKLLMFFNPILSFIYLCKYFHWYFMLPIFISMLLISNIFSPILVKLLYPIKLQDVYIDEIEDRGISRFRYFIIEWIHGYLWALMLISTLLALMSLYWE